MLGLAKRVKARILLASTSEIYGDPEVHPQPEVSSCQVSSCTVKNVPVHLTSITFFLSLRRTGAM
jgi:hypothetical protein